MHFNYRQTDFKGPSLYSNTCIFHLIFFLCAKFLEPWLTSVWLWNFFNGDSKLVRFLAKKSTHWKEIVFYWHFKWNYMLIGIFFHSFPSSVQNSRLETKPKRVCFLSSPKVYTWHLTCFQIKTYQNYSNEQKRLVYKTHMIPSTVKFYVYTVK